MLRVMLTLTRTSMATMVETVTKDTVDVSVVGSDDSQLVSSLDLPCFLFHPITLMTLSGLATFALFFHVVRRIVKKRRSQRDGQVQLGEGQQGELLFDNDADAKSYTDDEKLPILEEVVIVEEKSSA